MKILFGTNRKVMLSTVAAVSTIIIMSILLYSRGGFVEAIVTEQVYKSDDQTSATSTLQNDNELVLPLQKNKTYIIDGAFISGAEEESDACQIAFTIPTGAEMNIIVIPGSGSSASVFTVSGDPQWNHCFMGGLVSGTVKMGNQDGNFQLQWALAPGLEEGTAKIKKGAS